MKQIILDFDQLSDSREVLEAKEPNFMVITIYLILFLLFVAIVFMWFAEMDIVARAQGIVRTQEDISELHNISSGELIKLNYHEGKKVKRGDLLYKIDTKSLGEDKKDLLERKQDLKEDIEMLEVLKDSIRAGESKFTESEEDVEAGYYYNRYLSYQRNYEQLNLDYIKAQNDYCLGQDLSSTTSRELEELKSEYRRAQLSLEVHERDKLSRVEEEIDEKKNRLSDTKSELRRVREKIDLSNREAPISGYIQRLNRFNEGDYISEGTEMLRIIPASDGFRVDITIDNSDMAHVEEGLEVVYRFDAFSHRDYGTLSGELTSISRDSIVENDRAFYHAEGTLEDIVIESKDGVVGNIRPGNTVEARVVTRRKKILYILLEKLDFISKIY